MSEEIFEKIATLSEQLLAGSNARVTLGYVDDQGNKLTYAANPQNGAKENVAITCDAQLEREVPPAEADRVIGITESRIEHSMQELNPHPLQERMGFIQGFTAPGQHEKLKELAALYREVMPQGIDVRLDGDSLTVSGQVVDIKAPASINYTIPTEKACNNR